MFPVGGAVSSIAASACSLRFSPFRSSCARAEVAVGAVSKVQGQAQIGASSAVVGTSVHMDDRLRTGANARLQITFNDDSSLTLGENANVVIDRFVYNPKKSYG